jgi:hypothetical protein
MAEQLRVSGTVTRSHEARRPHVPRTAENHESFPGFMRSIEKTYAAAKRRAAVGGSIIAIILLLIIPQIERGCG